MHEKFKRNLKLKAFIYSIGTHAIGDFLKDLNKYKKLPSQGKDLIAVLELESEDYNPFKYEHKLIKIPIP